MEDKRSLREKLDELERLANEELEKKKVEKQIAELSEVNEGHKSITDRLTQLEIAQRKRAEINESKKGSIYAWLFGFVAIVIFGWLSYLFIGLTYGIIISIIVGVILFIVIARFTSPNFRMPFLKTIIGKKKKREGYVVVIHLGNNRALWFERCKVEEGVYIGKDLTPHVVDLSSVFVYKNKTPIIVQPQWAKTPLNPEEHYGKTIEAKNGTRGWQFLMNYILKTQIREKKQTKIGTIIVVVLVLAGIVYYAIKSGAFS